MITWKASLPVADEYHAFRTDRPVSACGIPFAESSLVVPTAYAPPTDDAKCEACKERTGLRSAL